jgi:O-antigen ligase
VWAIAVWFFAMMLQTGSRKAMLGGVVVGGGTVLLIFLYQRWRFRDGSFGPSLAASLLIVPAVLTAVITSDFWHRVERALEPGEGELTADNSLNLRIWLLRRAIDLWSEKPILGHGLRGFARALEADHLFAMPIGLATHSNYIDILVHTGLLGLLLYLSIYALLGAKLFALRGLLSYPRYFERYAPVTAILALIAVYDVAAISYYSKLLWLVLPWLIAEIQLLETDRRKFQVENMGVTNPGLRPK